MLDSRSTIVAISFWFSAPKDCCSSFIVWFFATRDCCSCFNASKDFCSSLWASIDFLKVWFSFCSCLWEELNSFFQIVWDLWRRLRTLYFWEVDVWSRNVAHALAWAFTVVSCLEGIEGFFESLVWKWCEQKFIDDKVVRSWFSVKSFFEPRSNSPKRWIEPQTNRPYRRMRYDDFNDVDKFETNDGKNMTETVFLPQFNWKLLDCYFNNIQLP